MSAMNIFIPLSKVDVAKRLVYGIATGETEDRSGEICDYASTKPHYEKWSGDIAKATDGKSLGNLRAMHGKVAAGKVTSIGFDDDNRKIEVCAKVVDDNEWNKVLEGVYTGFSQGGAYVKRWTDTDGKQRYTADPSEISLVDLPCLPEATFQVIKADGVAELHKFKTAEPAPEPTNAEVSAKATELAKAAGDEKKWVDFIDAARAELSKAAAPIVEAPATAAAAVAAVVEKTATPVDGDEWAQVWLCKRDGATFPTKAELRAHVAKLDLEAATKASTGPVLGKLDEISAKLGIEKAKYSAEDRAAAAKTGEAMSDGSFPIKNRDDVTDSVAAHGRASDKEAAKQHIMRRANDLGCNDCIPSDWKGDGGAADKASKFAKPEETAALAKYMGEEVWDASQAMTALQMLFSVLSSETYENEPDTAQTGALRDAIARVKDFIASEVQENHDLGDPAMALAAKAYFEKAGARNNSKDQARIQKAHDALVEAGAICGGAGAQAAQGKETSKHVHAHDLEKSKKSDAAAKVQDVHDAAVALGADCSALQANRQAEGAGKAHDHDGLAKVADDLAKMTAARDALQKTIDDRIMPALEEIMKRVAKIENEPLPLPIDPSASRSVAKADDSARGDNGAPDLSKILSTQEGREAVSQMLIKAAQSRPTTYGA